jgi:hypothetical protein
VFVEFKFPEVKLLVVAEVIVAFVPNSEVAVSPVEDAVESVV